MMKPKKKPLYGGKFREQAKRLATMRKSKKQTGPVHQRIVAARKSAGRY